MRSPLPARSEGPAPALQASRSRVNLIAALLALAGAGWWWTIERMRGMDNGPWTSLGHFGWFLGVWIVMMAAMMLPSVAPTIALYSRLAEGRVRLGWPPSRPATSSAGPHPASSRSARSA